MVPSPTSVTRRCWLSLCAAGVAGCRRDASAGAPLRVAVTPRVTMASTYLAHERGFFGQQGIRVSLVEMASGREALPMLASGQIDVALFSFLPSIPNAIARGARIRIVAARDEVRAGCSDQGALYYRRQRFPRGVERAEAWKGARIAYTSESANPQFYLYSVLKKLGVALEAVQPIGMKMEEAVAGAAAGHIDIFFGSGRPNFMEAGLPANILRSDLLERTLGQFQYSFILFSRRLLDGGADAGAAYLRAYLRGVRAFAGGETPRFLDEFASRLHMKPEIVRAACRDNVSLTGEVRHADLDRWLAWAAESGLLTQPTKPAEIVDSRFQQAAVAGL